MISVEYHFIPKDDILDIVPFMSKINKVTPLDTLKERIIEMASQNYKCLGIYLDRELIGICGIWFMTRHYCGRSMEIDHVIIQEDYQNKGLGNQLFDWLIDYAKKNNIEASELNTYVENARSHKFYFNLGYEIKGFHFVKKID